MKGPLSTALWIGICLIIPLLVLGLFMTIASGPGGGASYAPIQIPWPDWLPSLNLNRRQQTLAVEGVVVVGSILGGVFLAGTLIQIPWGRGRGGAKRDPIQVTFYTKPGCHLCEDAQLLLSRARRRYRLTVDEVNILEDQETFRNYDVRIPVLVIAGRRELEGRISERELDIALQSVK